MKKTIMFAFLAFVLIGFLVSSVFQYTKAQSTTPVWDFEDHGYVHSTLTMLSSDQIAYELTTMNNIFLTHNLPAPQHLAYPNGSFNQQVISVVSQYRSTGRQGNDGTTFPEAYPVANWYAIASRNIMANTSYSQVKTWVDTAVKQKGLMVIYTHQVSTSPIDIGCTPALLGQILDYLVAQQSAGGLTVMTMRQAYTQFNGQKAVVVVAFDDGWNTDYTVVYPMFKARGIAGTSYIVGNTINSNDPNRLSWSNVAEMAQVSPTPRTDWTVTVNSYPAEGGTTTCIGQVTVPSGSLTVTAMPSANYAFSYWLFDANRMDSNPVTLPAQPVGTSHTLAAFFTSTATPTPPPTPVPTQKPTVAPSTSPSASPTLKPSSSPSATAYHPTSSPTVSLKPSSSASPSALPTKTATPGSANTIFSMPTIIIIATAAVIVVAILAVGLISFRRRNHSH